MFVYEWRHWFMNIDGYLCNVAPAHDHKTDKKGKLRPSRPSNSYHKCKLLKLNMIMLLQYVVPVHSLSFECDIFFFEVAGNAIKQWATAIKRK